MKLIRSLLLTLSLLAASHATSARAHCVWIEPKDGQLVVRFAEPGEDFETSPGYLDNLSAPLAFILAANTPVVIEAPKKPDHFALAGATATNTACVESAFTVRGGRKPNFYARWQCSLTEAAAPMLTLDLVPTGKPGEARAYFRGQPLGGIKAVLHTPDKKETELTADAQGLLHFDAHAPGQYLLTLSHHREPLAGFHNGVAYKETSHNCALTWRQN